jgi:hypothetical protein
MTDLELVLEHSIAIDVSASFAWAFRTDISTWNDPPATFALDGPFGEGARGTTLLPGQEPITWWIRDLHPGRSFAIDMPLDGANLRFEWHIGSLGKRKTKLTHRILLSGSNASAYRQQVEAGFAANLAPGMERIAESMIAAEHAQNP